jgi:hypothetical protein
MRRNQNESIVGPDALSKALQRLSEGLMHYQYAIKLIPATRRFATASFSALVYL